MQPATLAHHCPDRHATTQVTNSYEFSQGTGYELPQYAAVIPQAVHSRQVEHQKIVIVGGGLSGLTLACSLAQMGISCVLLDEDNTVGVKGASSRGICYTQKSLEIFDKLGIYERIKAKGIQWSVGRTFAGHDEVYSFDLKAQGNFNLSEQPAFINIQQFYNEGFLVERIVQLGHAQIRWNNRITDFSIEHDRATFGVDTPQGNYTLSADFVVDATGSRSPFHEWLKIKKTSKKGDDRWCIADVRFSTRPPQERHTWIEAPFNEGRAVWQHLMADDVWRIDYQMAPDADAAYVSREDVVRERLARQFGADTKVDIVWVGPYAYRSECVEKMVASAGQSKVFLMGDSAKVVSPFGARGGNTGIADADNLAWKLAAVVQGRANSTLLDSYHSERHEAAQTNVQVTNRTARFLRPQDGMERIFRQATLDLAKQFAFARSLANTGRMAVANPYSSTALKAPDLPVSHSVQNVSFQWSDLTTGHLNALLQWARGWPVLLLWGDEAQAGAVASHAERYARIVQVCSNRQQLRAAQEAVLDTQGKLAQACGLMPATGSRQVVHITHPECAWALVRADSYLAACGQPWNAALVKKALQRLASQGIVA